MNLRRSLQLQDQLDAIDGARRLRLPEAVADQLQRALRQSPDSPALRLVEAAAALEQHRPADALRALDAHDLYAGPRSLPPSAEVHRALALLAARHRATGLDLLRDLQERFPDDPRPHRLLADALLEPACSPAGPTERERHEALRALSHVLRLQPGDTGARRAAARAAQTHDPRRAADILQGDPSLADRPDVRLWSTTLLRQAGLIREAREVLRPLLQESLTDPAAALEAGLLAHETGEDDSAVHWLQQAALGPDDRPALEALAVVHAHAGRIASAGRLWFLLHRRQPDDLRLAAALMACALADGRRLLARRLARRLTELDRLHGRSDGRWRRALARAWTDFIAPGLAQRLAARRLSPGRAVSPLATLLRRAADTLQAHALRHPDRADTRFHHAVCLEALGRTEPARAELDQALRINPRYARARALADQLRPVQRAA